MTNRTLRSAIAATAVVAAALGAVAVTHAVQGREAAPAAARPGFTIDGFDIVGTPAEAVAFTGNDVIAEVRVVAALPARNVSPAAAPGLTYAYRPVTVVVTKVWKGLPATAVGQPATLRALGGTVDGVTTGYEDAVPESTWTPGTALVVFGQRPVDVGDGLRAVTPNFVFVASDGRAVNPLAPEAPIGLTELRAAIDRRW